jgi:hypothetical protein
MNRTGKFEELQRLINEIEQSEGERILREILNMQASLRLVRRNYQELVRTIEALQQEKATLILHDIAKKEVLQEAFEVILTRLHNFLAAAFNLVDHMRRHRKHLYAGHEFNKEIDTKLHGCILSKTHHKVAQGLRNYCLHVSLPPIASRVVIGRDQLEEPLQFKESVFHLPSHSLLSWDGWTTEARAELNRMPNGLAILPFATEYFQQVEGFYAWLWGRQAEVHKAQLDATNTLKDKARSIYKELNPDDPRL